jgi:hypothetical protein
MDGQKYAIGLFINSNGAAYTTTLIAYVKICM